MTLGVTSVSLEARRKDRGSSRGIRGGLSKVRSRFLNVKLWLEEKGHIDNNNGT